MGDRDQHGRIKDVGFQCMVGKSGRDELLLDYTVEM